METIQIKVDDVNECPIVHRPKNFENVLLNASFGANLSFYDIVASDNDISTFSEIYYSNVTKGRKNKGLFHMKENSLKIFVSVSPLPEGQYVIDVVAFDKSHEPCSSTNTLTINILPAGLASDNFNNDDTTTTGMTTSSEYYTTTSSQSFLHFRRNLPK
ncbi:unnamed protein product [Dimorphilus gyrociliatus]|uniref:Cadherin domain-containing protein n=1 Tax=Dimorphilus gyrociliatus TaxID=2664684 RepID=A0A7I8W6V3_9ANNE|nr:unnamed protein product [Dimorphilus gyrociliatus]